MSELQIDFWRRCSSCKNPIQYSSKYFVCSVSTCNRKRIGYVFDSVHCWERHLPGARHRDAAAVEMKAPTYEQWKAELEADGAGAGVGSVAGTGAGTGSAVPSAARSSMTSSGSSPHTSPTSSTAPSALGADRQPQRVIVKSPAGGGSTSGGSPGVNANSTNPNFARGGPKDPLEAEILIVVSKLKTYIRERSEMNTSDAVAEILSTKVRRLCDRAIEKARASGRKTVLDRDFE